MHQGCAAHGSNDELAASEGLTRLLDFREAVENSFCCGASVDLLLIGIDTDTDAIRVHTPSKTNEVDLKSWVCANEIYKETQFLNAEEALQKFKKMLKVFALEKQIQIWLNLLQSLFQIIFLKLTM